MKIYHERTDDVQDLSDIGVTVEEAIPSPGKPMWRLWELRRETGGLHHIFAETIGKDGELDRGQYIYIRNEINGDVYRERQDKPENEYGLQFPMWKGNRYAVRVSSEYPSDSVSGLAALDPYTGEHRIFYIRFRLVDPEDDYATAPEPDGDELCAALELCERHAQAILNITGGALRVG